MSNIYDDKWLQGIQKAIKEGRAYITCSKLISDTGRKTINGYNHCTGWVTTGEGFSMRSFMVCPGDIHIVEIEAK